MQYVSSPTMGRIANDIRRSADLDQIMNGDGLTLRDYYADLIRRAGDVIDRKQAVIDFFMRASAQIVARNVSPQFRCEWYVGDDYPRDLRVTSFYEYPYMALGEAMSRYEKGEQ